MIDINEKIANLKIEAKQNFLPIVRDETIKSIVKIQKENSCKDILEIGTAIGYSGLIMLANNLQAKLTSIEKNEERFKEAKENFAEVEFTDRVNLICGDAYQELLQLKIKGQKYDFIFLDGPKGQYYKYLPILKSLLHKNGILFADNILLGGLLKNEKTVTHKNRTMVNNMKKFLNEIENDLDFQIEIQEIEDGYLIAKLKNSTD